jgi:hypothetical protein
MISAAMDSKMSAELPTQSPTFQSEIRGKEDVRLQRFTRGRGVTHHVTDKIGDDCRVARVIFGDALLNLADHVSADIGTLQPGNKAR